VVQETLVVSAYQDRSAVKGEIVLLLLIVELNKISEG
jgi:hypothetical protein